MKYLPKGISVKDLEDVNTSRERSPRRPSSPTTNEFDDLSTNQGTRSSWKAGKNCAVEEDNPSAAQKRTWSDLRPTGRQKIYGFSPATRRSGANRPPSTHSISSMFTPRTGEDVIGGRAVLHDDVINAIAPVPGGDVDNQRPVRFLSAGEDRAVVLSEWDLDDGGYKEVARWTGGHSSGVNAVAVLGTGGDGTQLRFATGGRDTDVRLWSMENGEAVSESVGRFQGHELTVTALLGSDDGKHVVSGSRDGSVVVWDAEHDHMQAHVNLSRNLVTALAWYGSSESQQVIQTSEDLVTKLWDMRAGSVVLKFDVTQYIPLCVSSHAGSSEFHVVTGHKGVAGGEGGECRLWDVRNGKCIDSTSRRGGHSGSVVGVSALAPGVFATCGTDSSVRLWNDSTLSRVGKSRTVAGGSLSVAAGMDGAFAAGSHFGGVRVWSVCMDEQEEVSLNRAVFAPGGG